MAPLHLLHKHALWLTTQHTLHHGLLCDCIHMRYPRDSMRNFCYGANEDKGGKNGPKAALSLLLYITTYRKLVTPTFCHTTYQVQVDHQLGWAKIVTQTSNHYRSI
jgi:hypothetical protein